MFHYEIKGLVGTAAVTQYSASVTGSSTDWDTSMEGKYIRFGTNGRLYTINQVVSTTSLTLTERYQGPTASGIQFIVGDSEGFKRTQIIPDSPQSGGIDNNQDRIGHFDNFDDNF